MENVVRQHVSVGIVRINTEKVYYYVVDRVQAQAWVHLPKDCDKPRSSTRRNDLG